MLIGKPFTSRFPNTDEIFCSDCDLYIDRVYSFKYLGIWFDDCSNFKLHAENVLDKVCSSLQCPYKLRKYLTFGLCTTLPHLFVLSHVLYGFRVWGTVYNSYLIPIQKSINRFVWSFCYPKSFKTYGTNKRVYSSHSDNLSLQKFNIFTVQECFLFHTLKFEHEVLKFDSKVNEFNHFFSFNVRSRRQLLVLPVHKYKIRENVSLTLAPDDGTRYQLT